MGSFGGEQSVAMSPSTRSRVLFLDAHDSFSNNITALLTTLLDVDVFVLPIDSPLLGNSSASPGALRRELAHYDAVVCGPGPGSPTNPADVGAIRDVWSHDVPALGVCLGFQSLVAHAGGRLRRLRQGLHGMVREIVHCNSDVFAGVEPFRATLYHSLCVDVGQDGISETEWSQARWRPSETCPDVVPLAWVEEPRGDGQIERILVAARHAQKPFWGVQYHPESVCTDAEAHGVIRNWFAEAMVWNRRLSRIINRTAEGILASRATRPSLLSQLPLRNPTSHEGWWDKFGTNSEFEFATVPLPDHVQIPDIVDLIASNATEQIVLDSANANLPAPRDAAADVRGRYSIIAVEVAESMRLEYHTGDPYATARIDSIAGTRVILSVRIPLDRFGGIWNLLAYFQERRRMVTPAEIGTPFLGGFMGYVTYEQGLSAIGIKLPQSRGHHRPDVALAWITKSLVVDHKRKCLYVQQLRPRNATDDTWTEDTAARLRNSNLWQHYIHPETAMIQDVATSATTACKKQSTSFRVAVKAPQAAAYEEKVTLCQEFIAAGDSYELCLTDQTDIIVSPKGLHDGRSRRQQQRKRRRLSSSSRLSESWQLFKTLRARQPAPFASYVRLSGATLVSASPERFLRYAPDTTGSLLCSMRPMKGTVRKGATAGSATTLAQAEQILHVPKEEAENLMIVDLVRHDLHGVCGAGNVRVPHLLKVEEYQSVFQMISVVEGCLPREGDYTGLDVLAASLPPGSMTGAPKKRSCEILRQIEGPERERGLYSGVVGYMCASGRGDWSVTIRSLFRWDDEMVGSDAAEPREVWHVGAGGAVTILSTPVGEREEMVTKLAGPLGVFAEYG